MVSSSNETHMAQQQPQSTDTTYTKIFVGGLAWETQRETMRRHFEQYGEILEAVVITDKNTGRSKGYGFVTFRDAEAARRACEDANPIIDGRRANCNLASLGANRLRPYFPFHGNRFQVLAPFSAFQPATGGPTYIGCPAFSQPAHSAFQHGYPCTPYGYSPYIQDYAYQLNIYNPYSAPIPQTYSNPGTFASPTSAAIYPYMHFMTQPLQSGHGYPTSQGYTVLPNVMQYGISPSTVTSVTSLPQAFGGLVPISAITTGMGSPAPGPQRIFTVPSTITQQFTTGGIPEQQ